MFAFLLLSEKIDTTHVCMLSMKPEQQAVRLAQISLAVASWSLR